MSFIIVKASAPDSPSRLPNVEENSHAQTLMKRRRGARTPACRVHTHVNALKIVSATLCSHECERHAASSTSRCPFSSTPTDTKTQKTALPLRISNSKPLKLLLVEDDLEHEQLLSEVLIEMDENRQWCY